MISSNAALVQTIAADWSKPKLSNTPPHESLAITSGNPWQPTQPTTIAIASAAAAGAARSLTSPLGRNKAAGGRCGREVGGLLQLESSYHIKFF